MTVLRQGSVRRGLGSVLAGTLLAALWLTTTGLAAAAAVPVTVIPGVGEYSISVDSTCVGKASQFAFHFKNAAASSVTVESVVNGSVVDQSVVASGQEIQRSAVVDLLGIWFTAEIRAAGAIVGAEVGGSGCNLVAPTQTATRISTIKCDSEGYQSVTTYTWLGPEQPSPSRLDWTLNGTLLPDAGWASLEAGTPATGGDGILPTLPPGSPYTLTGTLNGIQVSQVNAIAPDCGPKTVTVQIVGPQCKDGVGWVGFEAVNNTAQTKSFYWEPEDLMYPVAAGASFSHSGPLGWMGAGDAYEISMGKYAQTSGTWPDCSAVTPPPPPADSDGDGVADGQDQCPSVAGPASNGGCPLPPPPPADTDGDGTPDVNDNCPTASGPASNGGCPLPPPAPVDTRPVPTVKVKPVAKAGKIKVDIDPSLPKSQYWRFTVQKSTDGGETWKNWRSYKTTTKKEIRYVNPKKGLYRIYVPESRGYRSVTSINVTIKK